MTAAGEDRLLVDELVLALGQADVLTDPELTAGYVTDWTRRYAGTAAAVVRPRDLSQVVAVLGAARRHGAAVVCQGGNTGLVGASVPRPAGMIDRPQLLMNLGRLDEVKVRPTERLLSAGAGATLSSAERAAAREGLKLGIDIASRDSATLGGMTATNAGGMNVCRYGPMRSRLAGIEAVLSDGTVVSELSGLVKDNVGPSLAGLLAGSEGTLAVITRVLVRLEPVPANRLTALLALREADDAVSFVAERLRGLAGLEAAELTLRDGMELVSSHASLPPAPGIELGAGAFVTLEVASESDPTEVVEKALSDERVLASAVAVDQSACERLWAYRERHTEAVSSLGVAHKSDVAVSLERLGELIAALPGAVAEVDPSAELYMWGHVADGNVHANVIGPPADDYATDDAVHSLVLALGGSVSAEHGIGISKARWLTRSRSAGTLEAMARTRRALDPDGVLNPLVLVPA